MNAVPATTSERIAIRSMRGEDLPQVLEIDRQSFSMPWPASAYEYELHENPASMLWVAEALEPQASPCVVGMIVVWFIVDEAHIATIAVHPNRRGGGIAKQLLATAMEKIISRDFSIATLEVRASNMAAQNLYRLFGYQIVGQRPRYYRDNQEDALIMTIQGLDHAYLDWLEKRAWERSSGEKNDPR